MNEERNGFETLADWRALTDAVLALKAAIEATTAVYGRLPCPRCGASLDARELPGCPLCGHRHPPDGVCI